MQIVTEDEGKIFLDIAQQWLENKKGLWNDSSGTKSAIAEFLANEEGMTLYTMFEGD